MSALPVVRVWVGTTYFKVLTDPKGKTEAGVSLRGFVDSVLTQREFDYNRRMWIPTYNYSRYDRITGEAFFPRYTLAQFESYMSSLATLQYIELPPVSARTVSMAMRSSFQPREHQIPIIEFLTNPDATFTPLSAACGTGKTASTIAAIVQLAGPALIVLGMLIEQWAKEIQNFARLGKNDVVIIRGFDALANLWVRLQKGKYPKIVIISTRTLAMYCSDVKSPYSELPSYQEFLSTIGFKVKVFDECHTNFLTNVRIDLCTNIQHNIYLSATYCRSDKTGKRIFDSVYPVEMRYGESDIKRYTAVICYAYELGIPEQFIRQFRVAKGYSHPRYEAFLLKRYNQYFVPYVKSVIVYALKEHWAGIASDNQKALIICRTQQFVTALVVELLKYFPQYKVAAYFSGDASSGSRTILEKSDIIVSTTNSCSTGVDIKGLKTCINTVSFASEPLAAQTLGRLRQIPGETTIFVDLHNLEIPSHQHHYRARLPVYRNRALSVNEVRLV